jgi:UDP:flavonoid glycosyltransferase YjiC (YdhE family)
VLQLPIDWLNARCGTSEHGAHAIWEARALRAGRLVGRAMFALALLLACALALDSAGALGGSRRALHVLVVGTGAARADAQGLLELGAALRARGHAVRFAAAEEARPWFIEQRCVGHGAGAEREAADACCAGSCTQCPDFLSLGPLPRRVRMALAQLGRAEDGAFVRWPGLSGLARDLSVAQAGSLLHGLCVELSRSFPERAAARACLAAAAAARSWAGAPEPEDETSASADEASECAAGPGAAGAARRVGEGVRARRDAEGRFRPDVIVADVGAIGVAEVAELFRVPLVLNSASLLSRPDEAWLTAPSWAARVGAAASLAQRCLNFVLPRLVPVSLSPDLAMLNHVRSAAGLRPHRSQRAVFAARRVLVNTATVGLEYPRERHPHVHSVGPLLAARDLELAAARAEGADAEELARTASAAVRPGDAHATAFLRWVAHQRQQQSRRVVVVALGSGATTDAQTLVAVLDGLREYAVTWVLSAGFLHAGPSGGGTGRAAALPGVLSARRLASFASTSQLSHADVFRTLARLCASTSPGSTADPLCATEGAEGEADEQPLFLFQREPSLSMVALLAAADAAVVVSHCGLQAAQEAVLGGAALVCLPRLADQHDVAARVVDAGVGVALSRGSLQAATLSAAVKALELGRPPALALVAKALLGAGGVQRAVQLVEAEAEAEAHWPGLSRDLEWPWHKVAQYDVCLLCAALLTLLVCAALVAQAAVAEWLGLRWAALLDSTAPVLAKDARVH